jgi:hypothetical protein
VLRYSVIAPTQDLLFRFQNKTLISRAEQFAKSERNTYRFWEVFRKQNKSDVIRYSQIA